MEAALEWGTLGIRAGKGDASLAYLPQSLAGDFRIDAARPLPTVTEAQVLVLASHHRAAEPRSGQIHSHGSKPTKRGDGDDIRSLGRLSIAIP
jgi:hypothetical protein